MNVALVLLANHLLVSFPSANVMSLSMDSNNAISCVVSLPHGQYQIFQQPDGRTELWSHTRDLDTEVENGLTRQAWMAAKERTLNAQIEVAS